MSFCIKHKSSIILHLTNGVLGILYGSDLTAGTGKYLNTLLGVSKPIRVATRGLYNEEMITTYQLMDTTYRHTLI